jgi:predicted acyl esterase
MRALRAIGIRSVAALVLLAALNVSVSLRAQSADDVKAAYIKHEYQIPMRDSVKLFTSVYAPKDTSQKYPILLIRTPYSVAPYGADEYKTTIGPSPLFQQEGYIFVYQDVRGRWMSEGTFMDVRPHNPKKSGPADIDESSDTYDTIDWLIKNVPNHNGRSAMWGISYPGFYTAMGMIDAHPALKAVPRRRRPLPTGSSATTGITTARCGCRTRSTFMQASASRGRADDRRLEAFRAWHARRLQVLFRDGAAGQRG